MPTEVPTMRTRKGINRSVNNIALKLKKEYLCLDLLVIIHIPKGLAFGKDIVKKLKARKHRQVDFDFVKISKPRKKNNKNWKIYRIRDQSIEGKNILIIDHDMDTGYSLFYLKKMLQKEKPSTVRTCVFIDKKDRRRTDIDIAADYSCFSIKNGPIVKYGAINA